MLGFKDETQLHNLHSELMKDTRLPMKIANKYLCCSTPEVHEDYQELLKKNYLTEVERVNFQTDCAKITADVNSWVAEKTNHMIKELIGPTTLDPLTVMVLLNAVYFKGTWFSPFDPYGDQKFTKRDGSTKMTPFMSRWSKHISYSTSAQLKLVKIPYFEAGCYMIVAIPKDDNKYIDEVLLETTASDLAEAIMIAHNNVCNDRGPGVILRLPKFKIEYEFMSLVDTMKALGVQKIFKDGGGDFSKAFSKIEEEIYVSDVIHKAVIEVDEKGTKAAAASRMVILPGSVQHPPPPLLITIDRPFLYVVMSPEGLPLFIGICVDPK